MGKVGELQEILEETLMNLNTMNAMRHSIPSTGLSVLINNKKLLDFLKSSFFTRTLEGSFSAVSKPVLANTYSFCKIFPDLHDLLTFAPLQSQQILKM